MTIDIDFITKTYFKADVHQSINKGLCWAWAYLAWLHNRKDGAELCTIFGVQNWKGCFQHAVVYIDGKYIDSAGEYTEKQVIDRCGWVKFLGEKEFMHEWSGQSNHFYNRLNRMYRRFTLGKDFELLDEYVIKSYSNELSDWFKSYMEAI